MHPLNVVRAKENPVRLRTPIIDTVFSDDTACTVEKVENRNHTHLRVFRCVRIVAISA